MSELQIRAMHEAIINARGRRIMLGLSHRQLDRSLATFERKHAGRIDYPVLVPPRQSS